MSDKRQTLSFQVSKIAVPYRGRQMKRRAFHVVGGETLVFVLANWEPLFLFDLWAHVGRMIQPAHSGLLSTLAHIEKRSREQEAGSRLSS